MTDREKMKNLFMYWFIKLPLISFADLQWAQVMVDPAKMPFSV
jgi:hypothetical protein